MKANEFASGSEPELVYQKGVTSFPQNVENPFNFPPEVSYLSKRAKSKSWVNIDTAEKLELIPLEEQKEFIKDNRPYVKLYITNCDKFSNLSKPGWKVLSYIIKNIKPNKDVAYLEPSLVLKALNYKSYKQVYDGIVNLIENNFIARKEGRNHAYFINYNDFFNGRLDELLGLESNKDVRSKLVSENIERIKDFIS